MSHSPPPPDPFTLFVYGTLMHDGRNHSLLAGQRFLGPARTRPLYALFDLGDHPGLVPDEHGRSIEGELYEVDASRLAALEALEEAPEMFRLEPVEIEGRATSVFAYFYQRSSDGVPRLEGRWSDQR
jgi:gamma-glutamylaminecyclotransferase